MSDFWGGFRTDPRDPANAALRASDADRARLTTLLDEAYADGRLTVEEHDQRVSAALASVALGDFPPLVADLLPAGSATALARPDPAQVTLRQRAEAAYRRERQEALGGFLLPTLICLVIWSVTMPGGFFWPAFVMLGTGAHLVQTLIRREEIIDKRLEKLEQKRRRELGRGSSDTEDPGDPEGPGRVNPSGS